MGAEADKSFVNAHDARPRWVKILDVVRGFATSQGLQLGAQLATGQVVVTLFVVVQKLSFNLSCLASIFYVASELLIAQDQHVGSHLMAGAIGAGHLVLGSLYAGLVIMLARAPHVAYTTFLCLFSVVAWIPIAALRAKMGPLALVLNLGFAFTVLNAQLYWGIGALWTQAILPAIYTALVAALGVVVSGLVTLPSLARDQMRDVLAETLEIVGTSVSGYASHMLVPSEAAQPAEEAELGTAKGAAAVTGAESGEGPQSRGAYLSQRIIASFEQPIDAEYQAALHAATDPARQKPAVRYESHGFASVAELLPRLELCKRLLMEASLEPPQLSRKRLQLSKWSSVIASLETLILRCGALECVLQGREPLLDAARLQHVLGYDVMPQLRVLYSHVAACCSCFATTLQHHQGMERVAERGRLFEPAWAALEEQLAATLQRAFMQGYWERLSHTWAEDPTHPPHLQVRALMFVVTLTNEILGALSAVEDALEAAALHQTTLWGRRSRSSRPPTGVKEGNAAASAVKHALELPVAGHGNGPAGGSTTQWAEEDSAELRPAEQAAHIPSKAILPEDGSSSDTDLSASSGSGSDAAAVGGSDAAAGSSGLPRPFQRHAAEAFLGGKSSRRAADADKPDGGGEGGDSKGSSSSSKGCAKSPTAAAKTPPWKWNRAWTLNEVAWMKPLLMHVLCVAIFQTLLVVWAEAKEACRSWAAVRRQLRCGRSWQFFLKYWVLCSACTCVVFIVTVDAPGVRQWNPLYVLFTIVVVLSEKVETTVQKGIFRALGTVLGGAIGYVVMLRSSVATNPYALTVILCAWVFVGAFLALKTEIRYAVFLTLITTEAVVLCQYGLDHGAVLYFYARVVDIAIGLVVVMAVDILFLPWYSSSAVLELLGAGAEDATATLLQLHHVFVHAMQQPGAAQAGKLEQHETAAPALAGQERRALEQRLGSRLAGVQMSLAREQVLWRSGVLAMPKAAGVLKDRLSAVLLRMMAVEAVLQHKPIITGRYTDTPFSALVRPVQPAVEAMLDATCEVGKAVHRLLAGDEGRHGPQQLADVDTAMQRLETARLQLRRVYLDKMRDYHAAVRAGAFPDRTADDAVRWLSWAYSLTAAVDQVALMANTAAGDAYLQGRCHRSGPRWREWFGLKPREDQEQQSKPPSLEMV